MLELFPEGFEEVDGPDGVELAASKLGYMPVRAVDVDPIAVEVAAANAAANEAEIGARVADALGEPPLPAAEVAVANISLNSVEGVAARLDCSRLITSGYLAADRPRLDRFRAARRVEAEGWAADLSTR